MLAVLIFHGLVAAACFLGARLGKRVLVVGALAPLSSLIFVIWWAAGGNGDLVEGFSWIPGLGLDVEFLMDGFSALMSGLIGGVGVLVFWYSWFYFDLQKGLARFAGYLVVFAGAMFGLVTADNLLLLFVFWELTSVMSYLLIGFKDGDAGARSNALQALLVTGIGGLVMLAGLVLLGQAAGTFSFSALLDAAPGGVAVEVGLGLILVGAFAKSAQFPLHFWLPGAMSAPTPVSTYLHSATMVKAGIYLVARLAPVFAVTTGWWRPTVVAVAVVTMLVGGWRALAEHDIKLLLANGTVSQLGLIMLLVGWGSPAMTFAGVAMLLAHSLFKGALFMVAGIIDHTTHTRDIRRLHGLRQGLPSTYRLTLVAVASMAGIPPLLGFVTKEASLEALLGSAPWVVTGFVVVGSMLTVAYGIRLMVGTFGNKEGIDDALLPPVRGSFQAPAALLVSLTVVGGLFPWVAEIPVGLAAASLDPEAASFHLALWHGWGLALGLSAAALGGGWLLWRRPLPRLRAVTARVPDAHHVYAVALRALNRIADRVTSVVQNGSLPIYLVVILATVVLAPGFTMVTNWRSTGPVDFAATSAQIVIGAVVIVAAVAMTVTKRRIGAVLLLGAVGYGVAVLFIIQGAPDLALTQLLIETLFLALFVVVLTRLPDRFEVAASQIRRVTRLGIATLVGLTAMGLTVWTSMSRVAPSLAPEFIERAEPEGGGRNVVNVILTDFRALDTLGEITVLAIAAMGVATLVGSRGRSRAEGTASDGEDIGKTEARPMILDVVVDTVLRTGIVFAAFLLFAGHNSPGGGFIAGLVAGVCLVLRYLAGGESEMRGLLRVRPDHAFGGGLLIAILIGVAGYIWGASFLEGHLVTFTIPVFGEVKAASALVFDVGVFGVVVGLAGAMLSALGDDRSASS